MTTTTKSADLVLGCDVSKDTVTFCSTASNQTRTIANTREALTGFLATFKSLDLAVCEATGGYETALLTSLAQLGLPAHRADAVKVKAFIRSLGIRAKTDAIDAGALACYGAERKASLDLWVMPHERHTMLQALAQRRLDLVAMRTAEKNRSQAPGAALIARSCQHLISVLNEQIGTIEEQIAALIDIDPQFESTCRTLQQVKGVGPVTAFMICALMPELGTMTGKQVAALAGLAPYANQSGKKDNYRKVRGGRKDLRPVLFMAALSASKHDPTLRTFYNRLIKTGKKPIVAITAVMRKLIVILNARVRDERLQQQS